MKIKIFSLIKILLLFMITSLVIPVSVFATDITNRIIITDCATGLPISGANVTVITADGQPSEVTNSNGEVKFGNLLPEDIIHIIEVSHPEYLTNNFTLEDQGLGMGGMLVNIAFPFCMDKTLSAPIPIPPTPTDIPTPTSIPTLTSTPIPTSTDTPETIATATPTTTPSATSTEIDGYILAKISGEISQGEQKQAGSFYVPPGQEKLVISLSWIGSKMELIIKDPNGNKLISGSNNVSIVENRESIYAIILQPIPGNWMLEVIGVDIPYAFEPYQILVSSRSGPTTTMLPYTPTPLVKTTSSGVGGGIVFIFIIMGGSGIALYVYADRLRKKRASNTHRISPIQVHNQRYARFYIISGQMTGHEIMLNEQVMSIGRGSVNSIRIPDASVSRSHALLNYETGRWILYDKGSKYGTFVNGRRIRSYQLQNRDHIEIGVSQIEFREF